MTVQVQFVLTANQFADYMVHLAQKYTNQTVCCVTDGDTITLSVLNFQPGQDDLFFSPVAVKVVGLESPLLYTDQVTPERFELSTNGLKVR